MTGATGRLGSALLAALRSAGQDVRSWSRPDFDLDRQGTAEALLGRDNPGLVIHAAAWTDVDGCARDPALAMRRNGDAVGELAAATAARGAGFVLISTNEVFDGTRVDGRGYAESDPTHPANPYGTSKLHGERLARAAFGDADPGSSGRLSPGRLWIVRTCWLYGPPGNDFPIKILAARDRLAPDRPLPVVSDEIGSPTYAPDLATAVLDLVQKAPPGICHLANAGLVSRYEWAAEILCKCRPDAAVARVSSADYPRPSTPPRWAVLDCEAAARAGIRLRPWEEASRAYVSTICPA